MSRLLVKNLPPHFGLKEFKSHFSSLPAAQGGPLSLTDAKLPTKKDGTFRRFGFLGYRTPEQAERAKLWFDGTYVGSCKVHVEIVADGLHSDAPPPKRQRLDNPVEDRNAKPISGDLTGKGNDPLYERYMASKKSLQERKGKVKGPSWANEDFNVPVAGSSKQTTVKRTESAPTMAEELSIVDDPAMSDIEWMKRRMEQNSLDEEVNSDQPVDDKEFDHPSSGVEVSQRDAAIETIMESARLFVRNLTFSVMTEELEGLFARYGQIEQVHIPLSQEHNPKGLAYVTFKQAANAVLAYQELDGKPFQGRLLHVLPAVTRRPKGDNSSQTLKNQKLDAKKKMVASGKHPWDWGMLYMNSDAVVSSIADRFGISKADILSDDTGEERSSTNPSVKLALAETHIIEETKKYLIAQGINLSSFSPSGNGKPRKSEATILIKNIPYGTTDGDLREMFGVHGEIRRLVVPPAGTIALLEYDTIHSAEAAIKNLAYRRLKNAVLYLEKAPENVWLKADSAGDVAPAVENPISVASLTESTDHSVTEGRTLFVKNLAFGTTTEGLSRAVQHLPSFTYARVATKPDPKQPNNPSARLSMGFGFVGFTTAEAASRALKGFDGFVLDGHKLAVTFAGRGTNEDGVSKDVAAKGKGKTTKMIVKNVPFEATKKDIRQLFSAYGQLKSVRLPKRFDARSRGFAFLDFLTRQEAEQAYAALRHTHLLGRHLVLEWAEEIQDIDKLREQAKVGFGAGKELPGRKRKLAMDDTNMEDDVT